MKKTMTNEIFIAKAKQVHGDKYDYSKTNYETTNTQILIGCPVHGWFTQNKYDHLRGCGCYLCGQTKNKKTRKKKNRILYGVGINDYDGFVSIDGNVLKSYSTWRDMIRRCYQKHNSSNYNYTYKDCYVCNEWKLFSNFKKWFDENYVEGYQLDKDMLVKGNKVYSPQTCCFLPQEINKLITLRNRGRGQFPIGISKYGNGYMCSVNNRGKHIYLGRFSNVDKAFNRYKTEKEKIIKDMAEEYYNKGRITKNVYKAMKEYKIQIID